MKLSAKNLQINWLARNDAYIRGLVKGAYPNYPITPTDSLQSLIRGAAEMEGSLPALDYQDQDIEFVYLMYVIEKLPEQSPLKKSLLALLPPAREDSPRASLDDDETEDPKAPLLMNDEELSDDAYERGFAHFQVKREIARRKNLRWYLQYQIALLKRLRTQAWFGKVAALMYGLAIGMSMAGFMALTIGFSLITQNWWLLTVPLGISWFSMQTNFWISRRAPSELIFDLFTSPRETKDFSWLSLASWRSLAKEGVARFLGLCNASVYGGLTAYGTWEFLTIAGATGSLAGLALCGVATFALSMMVFLPELGFGIKFNRQQLEKSPLKRYQEMVASFAVDRTGQAVKPNSVMKAGIGPKYVGRFWLVFACVIVGAVFTALAAADMAATLMGVDLTLARILVSFIALTVVPFYFDKAIKNATNAHKSDVKARYTKTSTHATAEKSHYFSYAWLMRAGNAVINGVPAFLGGVGLVAGPLGIMVGVLTGFAGMVASYLSGEDGKQPGYEVQIDDEMRKTNAALAECRDNPAEPDLEIDGTQMKATAHPLLFRPFNTIRETRIVEEDLLEARVPMKLKSA